MIEGDAMCIKQESTWQLLLELVLPSRQQVVERIMAAVRGLGMQPSQAIRVEPAAMQALREAMPLCARDRADACVAIRVWTSDASAGSLQPASPAALEAGLPQDRGWGFFVVQTQEDELPASVGGSRHLVDLFLYQEG
jgi:hypothetical protein